MITARFDGDLVRPSGTSGGVILSVRDLHHSYGRTHALRGVSLDITAGEVVAIMGPSGSGKSTLLHCVAGVLVPDSGTVTFRDRAVHAMSESARAALRLTSFGFVFQFGQLLGDLTVIDNVTVPLLLGGTPRRRAVAEATTWLDRLGLAGLGDKLPGELSGGQAQRVAVARAMVTGPEVLFADEPTGALDSLTAESVMSVFLETASARGTTVVLITHDARTAAYADRTVIVRDGTVSASALVGAETLS